MGLGRKRGILVIGLIRVALRYRVTVTISWETNHCNNFRGLCLHMYVFDFG